MIFISHDNRDAELAEALSKLLSSVSAGVLKSFRSSDRKGSQGIEYGVEWYPELMAKLDAASDVVCLLTARSVDRPWILYEAGVAKGKLGTPLYGIALGIPLSRANTGPFAQFQNCDDNEESLTKLVMQLVRRIPGSEPDHDAIQMQVRSFKGKIDEVLSALSTENGDGDPSSSVDDASVAKIFEEVKVMFQDLPSRIEGRLSEHSEPIRRRVSRHYQPRLIDGLMHHIARGGDDPIGILIVAALFRDELPWLYELGRETYLAIRSGKSKEAQDAAVRLQRATEFTVEGPFSETLRSRELYILLHDLIPFQHHLIERTIARMRRSSAKKATTK
jgi:hypothetical protein